MAVTYVLLESLPPQFLDSNGVPVSGGKIKAFKAGTTTPTDLFSDDQGTVAGTEIDLDARGELKNIKNVWLDDSINYKIELEDSTGSQVWVQDDIVPIPTSGVTGSSSGDIRKVDSIADVRSGSFASDIDVLWVQGYYGIGTAGGGHLYRDPNDTTSTDNNGTIFVDSDGVRWKRKSGRYVSVAEFGADLTGASDSLPAWNDCFTWCAANKRTMFINGGTHTLASKFTADYSAWSSEADEEGPSIIGEGHGVTEVVGKVLLQGGTGAALHVHVEFEGMKFNGSTTGLELDNIAFANLKNLFFFDCDDAIIASDTLSCTYDNVRARFGTRGLTFKRVNGSEPNAITLLGCHIGHQSEYGVLLDEPSQWGMYGGSIEGVGSGSSSTSNWGLKTKGGSDQGQVGITIDGVYFEGTGGTASIWVDHGTASNVVHNIRNCNFNRIDGTKFVDYNIRIDQSDAESDGIPFVNVYGCAFQGYNSYSPNSSRPYIQFFADRAIINQAGNMFNAQVENPLIPSDASFAECRFDGTVASPTPVNDRNVRSITRLQTGEYEIEYIVQRTNVVGVSGMTVGAAGYIYLFADAGNKATIRTIDTGGTRADFGAVYVQIHNPGGSLKS